MQIPPSPRLAHLVKHYLVLEVAMAAGMTHRIFSDGNTGIVFNFGDTLMQEYAGTAVSLPNSFLYGQLGHFRHVTSTGNMRLIIAVLHPFSASAALHVPASTLTDKLLDLEDFFPNQTNRVLESILSAQDPFKRILAVEDFLTSKLKPLTNNFAIEAVGLIHEYRGNVNVEQIAGYFNVTERTLQRTFQEQIGLSPKRYAGIVRMQRFLKMLRTNTPVPSVAALAFECGYYDQAHLIREMKNLSGITPGQYLSQPLLTANFLQIPS
jgi:AraC-like DNA-binding protein